MADPEAIRRGLAALLRTALPAAEGHVSPYWRESPRRPCLQVATQKDMEHTDFGDGTERVWVIEGVFNGAEIGSQKLLDRLIDTVAAAVQSDSNGRQALFSRMDDEGAITTDANDPAADDVAFIRYEGSAPQRIGDGTEALLASWLVRVLA